LSESVTRDEHFEIVVRRLTEGAIQDLLSREPQADGYPPSDSRGPESADGEKRDASSIKHDADDSRLGSFPSTPSSEAKENAGASPHQQSVLNSVLGFSHVGSSRTMVEHPSLAWPPTVNALGLIGQDQIVSQLMSQINFCRASGRRFSDKLLVGPAGVGKSSLARSIAGKLLSQEEILFNGSDLRRPSMLISRLQEKRKLTAGENGIIRVEKGLLFIDEVHAISSSVVTALLSAMDDARVTTIDNVTYDFDDAIFFLATTDAGTLPEAFRSRPDKMYLRPYTLDEMAGIVWLHSKDNLNGYELPKEVCIEIAARQRCQPRRAVRVLLESLIPHFYDISHESGEQVDYEKIARTLTQSSVGEWFECQGVDLNGIDVLAKNCLAYLRRQGATSRERLQQALGISNKTDFAEVVEYLTRLGLVSISSAGCALTHDGRRYLMGPFDLRDRISRYVIE
jgi:Holliday junction resolvasome RuvABC ATP-dependent DNA helicase subunit